MKKKVILSAVAIILISLIWYEIISNLVFLASLSISIIALISLALGTFSAFVLNYLLMKTADYIQKTNFTRLVVILLCINVSCICGGLISIPLSALPGCWGEYIPLFVTFLLFALNTLLVSYRKEAFKDLANRVTNGKIQLAEAASEHESKVLLDTSVIIDGRIADISRCGFIPGTLIVPNFVLQELQFIADSEDSQRRQRGRRGLDTLAAMQKNKDIPIEIKEFDIPNIREVDAKLLHVALELDCPILTNDYNLNKVAELQGIKILNVNDLTNAVKSILLPGETLNINVIQEGKEPNQGVGYMEDGTMVVVENGRAYVDQQIDVTVTKILQTAAGRMIFARHEKELGVKR